MTSISSESGTEVSLETVREYLIPHLNRNFGATFSPQKSRGSRSDEFMAG